MSACCVEREQRAASRAASRAGEASRSSSRASRGGYSQAEAEEGRGYSQAELDTSDHEIEIQLQCITAASQHSEDSGGSQHSHRGCSVEDEDEILVAEEARPGHQQPPAPAQDLYSRQADSGESRAHSRNGYKSDGSHGSTQESPLHLQPLPHHAGPGAGRRGPGGRHAHPNNHGPGAGLGQLAGAGPGYPAAHLSAQYMQHPHHHPHLPHPQHRQLALHPNKHLEASRSFHTFQRQESTTSFHSTHSAPSQHHHTTTSHNLMVNNIESASQASTHSHSSSSSASVGPPDYNSLQPPHPHPAPQHHPPPSYDQALIKLDIAMRRRAATKRLQQQQQAAQQGTHNSLHYVGEFYG